MITTNLELSNEEREYLENDLCVTSESIKKIEEGIYDSFDPTTLIKILFTCSKIEDAWENIRANLDKVDFTDIFTCPFMQLDRYAVDVYKYMHDNSIIDDASYRYFEVLSGKLNDWEFWKANMNGKTPQEKLMFIHESYNGVIGANPYELGLVNLTSEQTDYIFGDLEDGEKVDFILEESPCINLEPNILRALIFNNNLQSELAGKYFGILFNIYLTMYDFNDDKYREFYKEFFLSIEKYANNADVPYEEILIDMNISDVDHLTFVANIFNYLYEDNAFVDEYESMKILVNNPLMISYSNTLINDVYGGALKDIKISKYLKPSNYSLVISYMLNPVFDTKDYIIRNPFPGKFPIVYNIDKDILFYNGKIYENYDFTNDPDNLFTFVNDYIYGDKTVNEDLFKFFADDAEYCEFVLQCNEFLNRINFPKLY